MKKVVLLFALATSVIVSSCSTNPGDPRLATGEMNEVGSQSALSLFKHAQALENAGKTKKAEKAYQEVAKNHPLSSYAGNARFRRASLLYQQGKLVASFDAYQEFITNHSSNRLYSEAIERQYGVAIATAQGDIKHNFMGIKSSHAVSTIIDMLNQAMANAPYSTMAPKAQFAIGELYQKRRSALEAISGYKKVYADYPGSSLAPEAMYRVGGLLLKEAEGGNRNRAALDQARNVLLDLRQTYPRSSQAKAAQKKLNMLASSNVQRSFNTAEFYRKKGQNQAAIIYYKDVLKASSSGPLYNQAKKRIAELSR